MHFMICVLFNVSLAVFYTPAESIYKNFVVCLDSGKAGDRKGVVI